jgi:crotonobetainyl-CoA:carnitine CoA-transferase CaiB-like acyl-CoA transferase
MGPLAGIRVLDLSRVLAGPLAGQILADMGCDVVKVERPGSGDDTRQWGPPYARDAMGRASAMTTYFQCANRGKRSIALDLSTEAGAGLVGQLASTADVVIENFKTGALARYGLDYASVSRRNPGVVYCSITGYGATGPYAERPGYDPIVQAYGGLIGITGEPDREPTRCGVAVVDILSGVYAATGISAALFRRTQTGRGQQLDLGLLDVQMASLVNVAQNYLGAGVVGTRMGSAHPSVVPSQVFRAADGSLMVTAGNDAQFAALCRVLGQPAWAADPRFATNSARVAHRDVLVPALADLLAKATRSQWVARFDEAGVPAAPVNAIDEAFADPQVVARGTQVMLEDPELGRVPTVASPLRFSEDAVEYRRPPPRLGEHTREVLGEWLGLDPAALEALERAGTIRPFRREDNSHDR